MLAEVVPVLLPFPERVLLQVPECELDPPRPQEQVWSGSQRNLNVLPRWPNTTFWPSAWSIDCNGARHVLQYNITDGWQTNLVDNGTAAFSYMGSTRIKYDNLTQEPGSFMLQAWPQTNSNWSQFFGAEGAAPSRGFYFATKPFNMTQTYNTTYRVYGNFTVYVTHLSNNDTTIACHNSSYSSALGVQANCSVVQRRHLQCPFTFRCFSPEMAAASGPRCLDDFDNGYNDTDLLGTLINSPSPKDSYGEQWFDEQLVLHHA